MNSNFEIVILEDNADRRLAMRSCLGDQFPQFPLFFFHEPAEFIAHLKTGNHQPILMSLDHDLDLIPEADGTLRDPGTGMDVVDWLIQQSPVCPVILHSTNLIAAKAMHQRLRESGWQVDRITPYDDLAWIDAEWFTSARKRLLQQTERAHP